MPRPLRPIKPIIPGSNAATNLQDNETYQRLLARREKMPLPNELQNITRIPTLARLRRDEISEVVHGINLPEDAAVTKL